MKAMQAEASLMNLKTRKTEALYELTMRERGVKDESSAMMTHIGTTATEYTMKHFAPLAPHWGSEGDGGCAVNQLL